MRHVCLIFVIALAICACGAQTEEKAKSARGGSAQAATPVPQLVGKNLKVRPGLWEAQAHTGDDVVLSESCVGADGLRLTEPNQSDPSCDPMLEVAPGQVRVSSSCDLPGVRLRMEASFQTSERKVDGKINLRIKPAQGDAETVTTTVSNTWVSDTCPADLAVGQVRLVEDDDE